MRAAGETVWRIERRGAGGERPINHVYYGEAPRGWHQLEPATGEPPRPLRPGEALMTITETPDRRFLHRGWVRGDGSFDITDHEMTRLSAPPVPDP